MGGKNEGMGDGRGVTKNKNLGRELLNLGGRGVVLLVIAGLGIG